MSRSFNATRSRVVCTSKAPFPIFIALIPISFRMLKSPTENTCCICGSIFSDLIILTVSLMSEAVRIYPVQYGYNVNFAAAPQLSSGESIESTIAKQDQLIAAASTFSDDEIHVEDVPF